MSQKLRVLHVVPYFPPDRIGGVGEVAAHLHRGLLQAGHDSVVLTSGTTHDDPRVRRVGSKPSRFVIRCALESDLLRRCDVVHCHHAEGLGLLMMNKLKGFRVPVVCTYHCSCAGIGRAHRPYRIEGHVFGTDVGARMQSLVTSPIRHALDRAGLWLVDQPIISRDGVTDILGTWRRHEAAVIYNGVPPLDAEDRGENEERPERTELLFVGSASHRKRINMLPFVLAMVRQKMPSAKLRIVGFDFESQSEFRRLAAELGVVDSIECVGPKLLHQLPAYYATSSVLLVPSAYEGLPMVLLEAQQHALPCVATNVSGHPEVIMDGQNGFLVELDNPQQMADRCVELLQNPDLRERIARQGQRVIRTKFGLERQTTEYLDLYYKTIAGAIKRGSLLPNHSLPSTSIERMI